MQWPCCYSRIAAFRCVPIGRQHLRSEPTDPKLRELRNGRWPSMTLTKGRTKIPTTITVPVLPTPVQMIVASLCGDLAFLATAFGRPFTANGFGSKFRDWCNQAGLPHCSAHVLRKAESTVAARTVRLRLSSTPAWMARPQDGSEVSEGSEPDRVGRKPPYLTSPPVAMSNPRT